MNDPGIDVDDDKNLGLLSRLPFIVVLPILLVCLLAPYVLFASLGPLWGLIGAVVIPIYLKIRYPSRGFGPMWLTMFDMAIVLGNGLLSVGAIVATLKSL